MQDALASLRIREQNIVVLKKSLQATPPTTLSRVNQVNVNQMFCSHELSFNDSQIGYNE
jgi:hypothetical protein